LELVRVRVWEQVRWGSDAEKGGEALAHDGPFRVDLGVGKGRGLAQEAGGGSGQWGAVWRAEGTLGAGGAEMGARAQQRKL